MNRLAIATLISLLVALNASAELDEVGFLDFGTAWHLAQVGDYVYVAAYENGLKIIDVSDPENPEEVGSWDDVGIRAWDVFVSGDYAFIGAWESGLRIIDVSNPENPEEVGSCDIAGGAWGVWVDGDYAYVAADESGVIIVDVADPGNPDEVASYNTPGESYDVFKVGDVAYVTDADNGICVLDVSDPLHPDLLCQYDTPNRAIGIYVQENYAYVADRLTGLLILDVSDPEDPREVGRFDTERSAIAVQTVGDYAFVADDDGGLMVVDVSDPANPDDVDFRDPEYAFEDVKVARGLAFIADQGHGLRILDVSDYAPSGPIIDLSAAEIDFGGVGIGLTADFILTITDAGDANLIVSDIAVDDEHFRTDFGGELELEPANDADITITFMPDSAENYEATLTITSNDAENGEISIPLAGAGKGAEIQVTPRQIDFGRVAIGETDNRDLTISNEGALNLIIPAITVNGDQFGVNFEDTLIIEPDDFTRISVSFTPDAGEIFNGSVTIFSNDPNSDEVSVALTGTGVGPIISVSPERLTFGEVGLHRSRELALTIRNTGLLDLTVSDVVVEHEYFHTDYDSQVVIPPGEQAPLRVTFAPEAAGQYQVNLFIYSDDRRNEELTVPMTGVGVGPRIAVAQDSISFGLVPAWRSAQRMAVIRALGLTDLTVSQISVEGDDFSAEFDTAVVIPSGNSYAVPIQFNPSHDGEYIGRLIIGSDDRDNPELAVRLFGTVIRGVLYDTPGVVSGVVVRDDYLYVADSSAGLKIFDASQPLEAGLIGASDRPQPACKIALSGDRAFVATLENGLSIMNIADPTQPELMVSFPVPGTAWDVAEGNGYLFVAAGDSGLQVIDIYDPERPVEAGRLDTPGFARSLALAGDYVYIADDARGLRIVSIANPEDPYEVGSYDTRGWTWDVVVDGELAYIADERYGLRIVDVSNPEHPSELAHVDTPGNAYGVAVFGNRVYVADGDNGLAVVGVLDTLNAEIIDTYYYPYRMMDVAVGDGFAFAAGGDGGLFIVDLEGVMSESENKTALLPAGLTLYPAYPNPFNSRTNVRYALPGNGRFTLDLYDLNGRRVMPIAGGYRSAGSYLIALDASALPSGVYLLSLRNQKATQHQRVILMR